jgi:radical SAM superfamily enzyme YgiQ (UPF0313 family)
MRILLVSANREPFPEPVYPIGLVYVAEALQQHGAAVKIFDMRSLFSIHSLKKTIRKFSPDVIALSLRNIDNAAWPCVRVYLPYHATIAHTIRSVSNARLILGGAGFSLFPEEINSALCADGGVKGEGENAILHLLNKNSGDILTGDHCDLKGLGLPRDIDAIFPYFKRYGTIGVQTARGCVNRCIYCTYPVLEGRRHRKRLPEAVADEIEILYKKYGKRNLFIVDSIFNADEEHMVEVLKKIAAMNLPLRLSVYLQPRVSDNSIFKLLKQAGCVAVDFGTDSGSHDVLASMKKSFTVEDIRRASRACRNAGIDYCHSLIFGGPGETQATIRDTVRLMDVVSPKAVIAMTGIRVYPGTEIEQIAQNEGILLNGTSLLAPQFYFPAMGRDALINETRRAVSGQMNWFFPGQKLWSDTFGYRLLHLLYSRGPLWRTFRSRRKEAIQ